MLKGTLEGCILKVISHKETYGYEISQALQTYGFSNISEGTIYPILLRLEKSGLIIAQHRTSPLGPKRKYFSISQTGQLELETFLSNWQELKTAVDTLFLDRGDPNE
ncbi:PadR family transcriptional regulator [Fusibacter ferrireducens]|uniref:PadR family transcriptional regulator n=1 Tax=Fusibacter ferrireducens TaxID=2785058 RepID=A0ABR9ZZV1_9FIRM|nr:PadR family transcriptional regulator [Fusibacter ferrireducens]MBF4695981.1 PadR family transcriptional regulator [Fusibacter ferrireducens]